jgi:hypothetical protein
MQNNTNTTIIYLQKDNEDLELLAELSSLPIKLNIDSQRKFMEKFPMLSRLRQELETAKKDSNNQVV